MTIPTPRLAETVSSPLVFVLLLLALAANPGTARAEDTRATVELPELRRQLLDLAQRDQAARLAMIQHLRSAQRKDDGSVALDGEAAAAIRAVGEIDREATAFMKEAVDAHGWPTVSLVGEDGAGAAWLLVQHADADPEFQARALELMEPHVATREVAPDDFALLTDRVRLAQGRPQLFATQFAEDESGVQRPRATEDFASVDARRAEMGLPPLAAYAKVLEESYGRPVSLEPLPLEHEGGSR